MTDDEQAEQDERAATWFFGTASGGIGVFMGTFFVSDGWTALARAVCATLLWVGICLLARSMRPS